MKVRSLTASERIAELVKARHEAHPEESNLASWKACEADPANAAVWRKYKISHYLEGVGARTDKAAGATLAEDAPIDRRYAAAVNAMMARIGLSGTEGRDAARHLLAEAEPELSAQYAASLHITL
jgi:hypothetical protein